MKKVLHILRNPHDTDALDLINRETDSPHQVTLLLIQNAAGKVLQGTRGRVYVLGDDLKEGSTSAYPLVDYRGMLKMIFENDTVITW